MGAQSFDDEIAQVPSRDGADRYFAPNMYITSRLCSHQYADLNIRNMEELIVAYC